MKVMIAVDESEYARAVGHFVAQSQWSTNSEFVVLSAVESLKVGSMMAVLPGPVLDEMFETSWKNAKKLVGDTANTIREQIKSAPVREEVIEGRAAQVILQFSQEWAADLIIMGSHGKTGFSKLMLGSVSLAVLSHASCSVLIVRLKSDAQKESSS